MRRTDMRNCAMSAVVIFSLLVGAAVPAHAQKFPFGTQHQAYRPATLVPTNFTQAEQNQDVADYYDYWKSRWLVPDPGGSGWRVQLDPSGTTVSEGQGYGMVIVAAMAGHDPQAQTIFDGLWQFRLAHPSENDNRLMDWNVPLNTGNDSAFDGDADIAYGLLMAHAQWGSEGAIDYLGAAKSVIAGIRESTIGPESLLPMLGDWVTPGGIDSTAKFSQWSTRSSDFMLGHFRTFGAATGDQAYWTNVTTAVQNVISDIQANEAAATGLLPDFIQLVGTPRDPQPAPADFLEGANDGDYWYNAGRDPWRLGVDAILNNDPTTLAQVQKLNQWIRTSTGGVPENIASGYQLDGTALNTWEDTFFIAPFAVAAMTGDTPDDQAWLNALYTYIRQRHSDDNYYSDAVTLQSLLAVTGNFWDPMAVLAEPNPGDLNRDGSVDGADFLSWQRGFPATYSANDLSAWKTNYGAPNAPLTSAVPEPATWVLVLVASGAMAAWSWYVTVRRNS